MTSTDKPKYGSLQFIDEGSNEEDENEDENNDAAVSGAEAAFSARSSTATSSRHSDAHENMPLNAWLRRDYSTRDVSFGFGAFSTRNLLSGAFSSRNLGGGGARGGGLSRNIGRDSDRRSSLIFGPTDRSIEALVRERKKAGKNVAYKSVDRGLIDTAIWHRRKVDLLTRRRDEEKKKYQRLQHMASFASGDTETSTFSMSESERSQGYKYDKAAVAKLQSERWIFDQFLVAGVGVAMSVVGLVVSRTADTILDKKLETALDRFEEHGFASGMLFHVGVSAALALGAFLPVAYRPVSAGSGIAEAKATLNGVIIPACTSLLTALCKAISVILSVSASLPAGLEGPMIHLGLCLGENANRLVPHRYQVLDPLRTDRSRIDYTAIGTAAGVAAAFRAPISGILFAMEEGASYWSTELTWRCFLSACVTVISMYCIITIKSPKFEVTSMDLFNGIDPVSSSVQEVIPAEFVPTFRLYEYGVFAAVGAGGGLIGAAFCTMNRSIAVLRRRLALSTPMKGLEVVVIATCYASLSWLLPSLASLSSCGVVGDRRMGAHYYRQYNCPEGHYNELATLLLNLGGKGITLLFQEDDLDAFSVKTCLAAGLVQLVTLCIAFGMSVSAGIFIPLLFIGACFGRALALLAGLDPRTYAIVGAAACLGGVVRVLISLTAIVTSTTSLSFFLTPVMVATLCAQTIGNWASGRPGIYDIILLFRDVPFLEEHCPEGARHANIRARNVMKTGVISIGTEMKVSDLVSVLKRHNYSDFPVCDRDAAGFGEGALVGLISRVDLLALLNRPDIFFSEEEEEQSLRLTPSSDTHILEQQRVLPYAELDRERPKLPLPTQEDIGKNLSEKQMNKYLHISPYLQIAPHIILGHASAERAYEMFRCLGLRTLLVIDKKFRPIGTITRHELALLEELGEEEHIKDEKLSESFVYTNLTPEFKNQFE